MKPYSFRCRKDGPEPGSVYNQGRLSSKPLLQVWIGHLTKASLKAPELLTAKPVSPAESCRHRPRTGTISTCRDFFFHRRNQGCPTRISVIIETRLGFCKREGLALDKREGNKTPANHRQPASRFCFVCGTENPVGLRLPFYNDQRIVWTEFTPPDTYQGWPGVLHGGIIAAVLDETIGRVAFLYDKWVQTGKLELKFRKPAPLGKIMRVQAELVKDSGRVLEMRGALILADTGDLLAEATGLCFRIPDQSRKALALQLGDEFEVWETWLAQNRQEPIFR